VTVPAEQNGTFSAGNIAVAEVGEGNSLAFNNVNAFLCVQLVSDEVTKIHVKSVGGLYKDQLGNSRGNGAWWPGSYQGAEDILADM
jgi:hypothetical protein